MKFTKANMKKIVKQTKEITSGDFAMVQVTLTFPVMTSCFDKTSVVAQLNCAADEVECDENYEGWVDISTSPVTTKELKEFAAKNKDWYVYNDSNYGDEDDFLLSDVTDKLK
jgi:hypothetical protein